MTNLEVKEDGLIYVDGILVSDQEKAVEVLRKHHYPYGGHLDPKDYPGIYLIPDLQWEVKDECEAFVCEIRGRCSYKEMIDWRNGKEVTECLKKQVAILKESTPSHFNGCSPTACGCKSLADCPNNQPQITVMGQGYKFKKFPERLKESTPSTEQESQEELWDEAQLRVKDNLGTYSNDLVCDLARWAIEEMKKHYIITRKP